MELEELEEAALENMELGGSDARVAAGCLPCLEEKFCRTRGLSQDMEGEKGT